MLQRRKGVGVMVNLVDGQEIKVCPLLLINGGTYNDCRTDKCAWYLSSVGKCAIWKLANDKGKTSH